MAFILSGQTVISYCEAIDIRDKDQRVFEANEINFSDAPDAPATLDEYLEDLATKSTARINQKIRASAQWREYVGVVDINDLPAFESEQIMSRKGDFTDLCAYYTLKEYVLPKVADFGNPESPEVQKITYYENKFNDLFQELMGILDWYDLDDSGAVDSNEQRTRFAKTRRTRGRRPIVRVR